MSVSLVHRALSSVGNHKRFHHHQVASVPRADLIRCKADIKDNNTTDTTKNVESNKSDVEKIDPSRVEVLNDGDKQEVKIETEEELDTVLRGIWDQVKKEVMADSSPEEAQTIEAISYDDIVNNRAFEKYADQQLGPLLKQIGVEEKPLAFVIDVVKLGAIVQIVTFGTLFYGMELMGHYNAGDAFRAVSGLLAGYVTRPLLRTDVYLAPIYNALFKMFIENVEYQVSPATSKEMQDTTNRLGLIAAFAFFIPQLLWGWTPAECVQFTIPLMGGWFLFDVCYITAILVKLGQL